MQRALVAGSLSCAFMQTRESLQALLVPGVAAIISLHIPISLYLQGSKDLLVTEAFHSSESHNYACIISSFDFSIYW